MAYDDIRKNSDVLIQYEFVTLYLPVVSGVCTLGDGTGWYTPKTCQESADSVKDFTFASTDFDPKLFYIGQDMLPQIVSISETPPKLKPGQGLGSRGSLRIVLADFDGDPGPIRTSENGRYFQKMKSRWIMEGHKVVLNLAFNTGETISSEDIQQRTYRTESMTYNNDNTWTLECSDYLYFLDKDETVWPPQTGSSLRASIDDSTTSIPVDGETDYSSVEYIRIGDEILTVTGVSGNQTGTATLTVSNRGSSIRVGGVIVSRTESDDHDSGDEVFICRPVSNMRLDDLLSMILTESGLDPDSIPTAEWEEEINQWHPSTLITTLFVTPDSTEEVVSKILQDYLMDMWMDVISNTVRLSAISVWRESDQVVKEGLGIQYGTLDFTEEPDDRYSRASIMYGKKNLTDSDDIENYRKLSINIDTRVEDLYDGPRLKKLDNSFLLNQPSADLLVQRFVSRYKYTPQSYTWACPEKFLDFGVGDVVDMEHSELVGFDGLPNSPRAQITSIQPKYSNTKGRSYTVKGYTYEQPAASSGDNEFTLSGRLLNINLFIAAGAPPEPVEVTFILNNVTVGSDSTSEAAIRSGGFAAGSKIKLVVIGLMSSKGGGGGRAGSYYNENNIDHFCNPPTSGGTGGIVYDAEGIDTDIYLVGNVDGINADGFIKSPGGGGNGGIAHCGDSNNSVAPNVAGAGGGGAGIEGGSGGAKAFDWNGQVPDSTLGEAGGEDGTGGQGGERYPSSSAAQDGYSGGTWGQDVTNGGQAGKGLVKNGATVNVYTGGESSTRFINGHGDTPDTLE